ncbi:GTP-binding protein Rhes-like [Lineus longissimus]|uniref:GTP-binding protein Rhes-like n=1 Tax=Lineus longissimus TaxID=88925 RepID=UPI002B4DE51E
MASFKASMMVECENAPQRNCHRLVILGSAKVGKTAIVQRFLYNRYDDNYTPTIEDFHRKIYRIRGEPYRLDILDTSGNHPFPAMRRLSFLTGDLFILVFGIDSRESFDEVLRLRLQILESKGGPNVGMKKIASKPVPMVIVGNKADKAEKERQVESDEVKTMFESEHSCCYLEVSAKKNLNINDIFVNLFRLAQLPTEMSPSLHRKVQPNYVSASGSGSTRRVTIRRRLSDACGAIAPNARRPSLRTDLMALDDKDSQSVSSKDVGRRDSIKCMIQ